MTHAIFMYGSNLDREQLKTRAKNWDLKAQKAYLPKHELRFNKRKQDKSAAANICPHPTRSVWGIIVKLNNEDLYEMDFREGHPKHYARKPHTVYTFDEQKAVEVDIYIAQPKFIDDTLHPSREYLQKIIDGGHFCGLPGDYLKAIEQQRLI
ncbi:gamma-glutamylcyclotransferase [Aphanothece hegewaldii CCALA 016]|uniref:Gamma-glutamylcyclotransferase n=1 Tax=Aphanothece hegewaldii CCALA 016 TaxID=2107694 RepID=A0A2T1LWF0_9CHRO|nr:gamma-glutamylcyclotransferase family protein [Aphanothece hegewaldii]PSF36153.1 gamma-glutamylcyclotransferase [Aphanothece hegewaldii CCALA 016]